MSGPMKKRRTSGVEVIIKTEKSRLFMVPEEKAKSLVSLLEDYETSENNSVSVEEVFKSLDSKYSRPGAVLQGARLKEGLTQVNLAKKLNVDQGDLSKMENGKRPIGKAMAKKLSVILYVDYRVFL